MLSFCNATRLIYIICSLVLPGIYDSRSLLVSRNILWKTPYMYCLNMLEMRHRYGRSETKLWTWFDMICFVALELGGLLFPASKRQPAPRHALRWWSWDWRPAPVISPKSSNISAMQQAHLSSPSQSASAQEKAFVRDHFADAVHCLASVAAGQSEVSLKGGSC